MNLNENEVEASLSYAQDLYVAGLGTTKLELPYTIQNNKSDTIGAVKNR